MSRRGEPSRHAGHHDRRELERELAALHEVAAAMAGERDQRTVLASVAEGAARALGAESGLVARFEHRHATLVGAWSASAAAHALGGRLPLDGSGVLGLVRRSGRAIRVESRSAGGAAGSSRVAAPVHGEGGLWGAVQVTALRGALPGRAEECLCRLADLTALAVASAAARSRLVARASMDHLTGLPNRHAFEERLAGEVALARRHRRPLAVVVLDLDHFKRVNDGHGHPAGDRVLAETGRRLAGEARSGELIGRVGGEEFAWLLPGSGGAGAGAAAERARRAIGGAPFPGVGRLTISAGVADLDQIGPGDGAEELYGLADVALYWAKAAGRDACARYSRDDGSSRRTRTIAPGAPRPPLAHAGPPEARRG